MPPKIMRSVALPAEHGAWSLWLEPVMLALLIAPSLAGAFIAVLSLAALLIRQPLKIFLIDIGKRRIYPRTKQGALFVSVYGGIAAAAFLAALLQGGHSALLPLIPACFVAALVVWRFDLAGSSRHWLAEVLAAAVMAAFAVSICLAGNWGWDDAIAVGVIVLARSAPAVIYVRARLRQIKAGDNSFRLSIALHIIALGAVLLLYFLALAPLLSAIAVLMLLARAVYHLRIGSVVAPKTVGIQEVVFGLVYVLLAASGYLLQI